MVGLSKQQQQVVISVCFLLDVALEASESSDMGQGNAACWSEGFTFEDCCAASYGAGGNTQCWDAVHTYANCCLGLQREEERDDFESLMARGRRGDASVLPRLMQLLASGGDEDCSAASKVPQLRCEGTPQGPSSKQWREFFNAHSTSRFARLEKWPPEAEPSALFERCCSGPDAEEALTAMAQDCIFGVIALVLSALPAIEHRQGVPSAQRLYLRVQDLLEENHGLTGLDCHWKQQVNHASFHHYSRFFSPDAGNPQSRQLPCASANVRIYVDDRAEWSSLRAHPLRCAGRGLCFTEVWLHQFLRQAACRVHKVEDADFVYVPIYAACYGLDDPDEPTHSTALENVYRVLEADERHTKGGHLPPILLALTCEKWKLQGWDARLRANSVVAAVESRPLVVESQSLSAVLADAPQLKHAKRRTVHCEDCFEPSRDFVIPSAVLPADAARFRYYNKEPSRRELLLTWHGEHARTQTREDVAEGYREVNETVRLDLLDHLSGKPDTSVGGPSLRYSYLMGNSHFCLVPRGRGWWTVRLFETFYAGCIPVLLSDDQELPFTEDLDWERFSLKWPMRMVGNGLHEYLEALVRDHWEVVEALHAGLRAAACWFDFHAWEDEGCSPYLGLLRQLERRKNSTSLSEGVAKASTSAHASIRAPARGPFRLRRFWF